MLIKSRPRILGTKGPDCGFFSSYPPGDVNNPVFYMPHGQPNRRGQQPKRKPGVSSKLTNLARPRSAPLRPRKPVCATGRPEAAASKRVLNGSKIESKITSKYHERCFPHWVPAPGLSTKEKATKIRSGSTTSDRRQSYPLCLVCEYDHTDCKEDESMQELYEKFQKGAFQLEELDKEVRKKAHAQRAKVLNALWQMDEQSRQALAKKDKEPKIEVIDSCSDIGEDDLSWQSILAETKKKKKRSKKSGKKQDHDQECILSDNTSSISIPDGQEDLDFVPDRDWSTTDNDDARGKEKHVTKVEVEVHREQKQQKKKKVPKEKLLQESPKLPAKEKDSKISKKPSDKTSPSKTTKKVRPSPNLAPPSRVGKMKIKKSAESGIKVVKNDILVGENIFPVEDDPDQIDFVGTSPRSKQKISKKRKKSLKKQAEALNESVQDRNIYQGDLGEDEVENIQEDFLGALVDQCNAEHNFGPDESWKPIVTAETKREQFRRRFTKDSSSNDSAKPNEAKTTDKKRLDKEEAYQSKDLIKEFVEQSLNGSRRGSVKTDEGAASNRLNNGGTANPYANKDIMREFVDQSLEREAKAMKEMENDLQECLDMIERSISGKIISNKDEDNDDSVTNASESLPSSNGNKDKFKSDGDVFTNLLIEELKNENHELKFALVARNQRLEDAASKVKISVATKNVSLFIEEFFSFTGQSAS